MTTKTVKKKTPVKAAAKTKATKKPVIKGGGKELTQREKDFLKALVTEPSQTKAYQKVYPGAKSDNGAGASANAKIKQLLRNPKAGQYMKEIADKLKEKPAIASAEEVLSFLSASMRGEIPDQFGLDASLADRQKAAELLGKKWALFKEQIEVKGEIGLADVLHKARKRVLTSEGKDDNETNDNTE